MESSLSAVNSRSTLVVADTSAVINLSASGCAEKVIKALPHRIAIVDVVPTELAVGRGNGHTSADLLQNLLSKGAIDLVSLDDAAAQHFEELVIGPTALTLDDGEAATIAYAAANGGMALLDERKAIRIATKRFPSLRLGSTVDLFADSSVAQSLGHLGLPDALFKALRDGRMRVLPPHLAWVVNIIGSDRAALCASLPDTVRNQRGSRQQPLPRGR